MQVTYGGGEETPESQRGGNATKNDFNSGILGATLAKAEEVGLKYLECIY